MAAMTPASKVIAKRLLAWDRARVAAQHRRKPHLDPGPYLARLQMAEVAIDADVDAWPAEVRGIFRKLLEVTRTPGVPALQFSVGALRTKVPVLNREERAAYRQMAKEIGVIHLLREVSPAQWRDEEG